MPKIKTKVIVKKVNYICDNCEEGHMLPTGVCLPVNPPLYPHKCDKCGAEMRFRATKYPHIIYENIDD